MIRAVQHLHSLRVAPRLHAFTSHWRLHLTTAPSHQDCDRHYSVSIVWRHPERRFHLALGRLADGWADDRSPDEICEETAFPAVIEAFIRRLLASASQNDKHDG